MAATPISQVTPGKSPLTENGGTVSSPPPELREVVPSRTVAGVDFNVQSNGRAAIGLHGAGFEKGAMVLFDYVPAPAVVRDPMFMTAEMPAELYARIGRHPGGGTKPGRKEYRTRSDSRSSLPPPGERTVYSSSVVHGPAPASSPGRWRSTRASGRARSPTF